MRPKDEYNRKLLEDFIAKLIETKSQETIAHVIPQKGTFVEVGNRVLIGLVRPNNKNNYYQNFLDGKARLYYTGRKFPTNIALQNLHYFVPYFSSKGIRDVYEIVRIRTISTKEVKRTEDGKGQDDLRLAFELRFNRRLSDKFRKIDTHNMINYTFIDTTFDKLEKL